MRLIAVIIAAVLPLGGCGSSKSAGNAPSVAPATVTVTVTPSPTPTPTDSASATPTSLEQAEVNYQEAVCSATLQIYVAVDQKSYKPPTYSRAVRLGLDGCTKLTNAQYEQAIIMWVNLGD